MFDDGWSETFTEWLEELRARVEHEDAAIRLRDAAIALRATSFASSLESFDDDGLAHMVDENMTMADGVGVVGARDDQRVLVDPATATLKTIAAILHRRKFSHRITAADVANRVLALEGPLGLLDFDLASGGQLNDSRGNPLDRSGLGGRNLAVPEWVDGFDVGRLLVAWREGDQVRFEVIDDGDVASDGATEWQAIADRIQKSAADGVGVVLNHVMFDLTLQNPSFFTTTALPIDELLRANGYANRGEQWGPADSDWKTPGQAALASRLGLAAETYGLQRHAQLALARLIEIWREWSGFHTFGDGELPEIDVSEIQDILKVEKVPLAFFDMHEPEAALSIRAAMSEASTETTDGSAMRETALDLLADELHQADPDSIAALLLTGRSRELHGQVRSAEAAYRQVLRRDETNGAALVKCLNAAVDASRFDEGARLVRRLSGPDSTNERMLQSYAEELITASRNESCPCGSGRKYKQCHQDVPLLPEPIATRAMLLKLEMYAEQTVLNQRYAPGGGGGAQAELVGFPEARDFMIHEGGLLGRFLQNRAEVLPPSELERLRSWQAGRRDLYEIVDVDPGVGMNLRNMRTGDGQQIVEQNSSQEAELGQLLLLRLETINGVTTSYGQGILVPGNHGDRVLEIMEDLDIEDLLRWFVGLLTDAPAAV